jgi:tetratricopeptide (TPR) repeat protein
VPEAVEIAARVADALGYAHERGVIHRDVTARNIMLSNDGRVVVLDFGLALAMWESRLTTTGNMLGTAPYMAPEVLAGHDATALSDQYSLGVVLYEALTGTHPFTGDYLQTLLFRALHEPPAPPREHRPEIPPALDALVLRALAREPAQRFASMGEFAAALRSVDARPVEPAPALGPATTAVAGPGAAGPGGRPDPLYLAVLPFADAGGRGESADARQLLAGRLAGSLATSLAGAPGLRVLPPAPGAGAAAANADPAAAARALGANACLRGEVAQEGSQLRVSFALLEAAHGAQFGGAVVDGSTHRVFELEDRVVAAARRALGLPAAAGPAPGRGAGSRDPAAHERYLQAVNGLRRYDQELTLDGAIHALEQLAAAEPEEARLRAGLGRALLFKYRMTKQRVWEARAAAAIELAMELDGSAPEVHLALGDLHVEAGSHAAARAAYEHVLAAEPDNFDARLGIARLQRTSGSAGDAERAAQAAIDASPGDWRGHNLLGRIRHDRGDFAGALVAWRRVVELTPDNPVGHRNVGVCLHGLGRFEEAADAFRRSLAIQPNAFAYSNLATALYYMEDLAPAATAFRKATELRPADPLLWGNLGVACQWIPGHEQESASALDRAIALATEQLARNPVDALLLGRKAEWLATRGHATEARQAIDRALLLAPEDVDVCVRAAHVCFELGERAECLRFIREAVKRGHPTVEFRRSREFAALRGDPAFEEILAPGRAAMPAAVRDNPSHEETR